MEKKNIDWSSLDFSYHVTEQRYVANYKNGAWDEGGLTGADREDYQREQAKEVHRFPRS